MRVGLVSYVHPNLPALETVLNCTVSVDEIICVDDVVGYSPCLQKCLERVRSVNSLVVQSNHDGNVGTSHRYEHNEIAHAGLEFVREELNKAQREWLAGLPQQTGECGRPTQTGKRLLSGS